MSLPVQFLLSLDTAAMAERAADWLHACQPAVDGGEPTLHDDTPPADSIAQSLAAAA